MSATAVLESEARARRWAAPVTAAAAALPIISAVVLQVVARDQPSNALASAVFLNDKASTLVLTGVLTALGMLLAGGSLIVLADAVRVRRPELPPLFRYLGAGGAVLAAVGGVLVPMATVTGAGKFVSTGGQTYQQYIDLFPTSLQTTAGVIQLVGSFALGSSLAVLSFNALRVGLLPRFTGYVGVFAGVFLVIPIIPVPIVLCFWLGALAMLYAGRWPSGMPPAWKTGKAEPWPSPGQAGGGREAGRARDTGRDRPAPATRQSPPPPPQIPANPGEARRKRKKRH